MFNYPKDIRKLLEQAGDRKGIVLPKITDSLPENDVLEELVEVAYHASFKTEEQRRIAFRVAFCAKSYLLERGESIYQIRQVVFPKAIPYNVNELLRLAPATDYRKVLIGVAAEDKSSVKSFGRNLKIWGLIDVGLGLWKFIRGEGKKGFASLDCLTISSDAPGSLAVSLFGELLVILRHGKLYTPPRHSLRHGPLAEFFQKAQDEICNEFLETIGNQEEGPFRLDGDLREEYIQYLERLIFHIRDKLHGGTVVVLSRSLALESIIRENRISIKYRSEYDIVWDLIVKKAELEYRGSKIFQSMVGSKIDMPNSIYWESKRIEMELRKAESYLYDSVLFLSSLASVDGALVINDKLKLFGFGAEFRVSGDTMGDIKFSEDAFGRTLKAIPYESFGTRHRSAFRFCNAYPNSVAFIISQDGDIKGIRRVNNDLIVWPDPNAGLVAVI